MSLTSLNIASDGLLDRGEKPALSIASRGLIHIAIIVVTQPRGGTGGLGSSRSNKELLAREDEEIMTIVIAFLGVQDK